MPAVGRRFEEKRDAALRLGERKGFAGEERIIELLKSDLDAREREDPE